MMCINSQPADRTKLKEGEVYNCDGETYVNSDTGNTCYFIEELQQLKKVIRFVPCSDEVEPELVEQYSDYMK